VLAVFGSGAAAFILPDALKPDIQCVRTHWIRGLLTFAGPAPRGPLRAS